MSTYARISKLGKEEQRYIATEMLACGVDRDTVRDIMQNGRLGDVEDYVDLNMLFE